MELPASSVVTLSGEEPVKDGGNQPVLQPRVDSEPSITLKTHAVQAYCLSPPGGLRRLLMSLAISAG